MAAQARSEGLRGALGMARGLVEGWGQVAACQKRPWGLPDSKNGCLESGAEKLTNNCTLWAPQGVVFENKHMAVTDSRC